MLTIAALSDHGAERDSVSVADSLLYLDAETTENVRIENAVITRYDRRIVSVGGTEDADSIAISR